MTLPRKIFLFVYWVCAAFGIYVVYTERYWVPVREWIDGVMRSVAPLGYAIALALAAGIVFGLKDFIWSTILFVVDSILGIAKHGAHKREVLRKAINLKRRGKYKEAGALFEEVEELDRAAECYVRAQYWENAARILEYTGDKKQAARLYEKAEAFEKAAAIYDDLKDTVSRVQLHLRCAERALRENRLRAAADHFIQANQPQRGAEVLQRMKNYEDAGDVFMRNGEYDRAAHCYRQQLDAYLEAIRRGTPPAGGLKKVKKMREKAAEALVQGDSLIEAAQLYFDAEQYAKAGSLFAQAGAHDRAAEAFLKSGDTSQARESIRRSGNTEQIEEYAALDALESGDFEEAGKQFIRMGQYDKAMEAYRRSRNYIGMAQLYEKMGRYVSAAEQYSLGGDLKRAAEMFEAGNDLRQAAEVFREIGNLEKAVQCLEKENAFFEAGELYEQQGNIKKAIACMQKVKSDDKDYPKACATLSRLFSVEDQLDESLRYFQIMIDEDMRVDQVLPEYYALARKLEERGRIQEAAAQFQRIIGIDYSFEDAAERLAKLREEHPHALEGGTSAVTVGRQPVSPEGVQVPQWRSPSPPQRDVTAPGFPDAPSGQTSPGEFHGWQTSGGGSADRSSEVPTYSTPRSDSHAEQSSPSRPGITPHPPSRPQTGGFNGQEDSRYELLEEIGRGGMGVVYKAKDTMLDRIVALKMLPSAIYSESQDDYQNFLREARTIAKLTHKNIVTIYDIGRRADRYYFSMEYVSGSNLRRLVVERGAPMLGVTLRIAQDICSALEFAHSRNIIHRDIKPGNILISENDEIKIVDFGLAKIISDHPGTTDGPPSVSMGFMMGTPHYMSPEQIRGEPIDHRTDIYAFGLTLYFMLTGKNVFDTFNCKSPMEVVNHQLNTDLPSPLQERPDLPPEIDLVFLGCIDKDREKRFNSMREVIDRLAAVPASS